MLTEYIQAAMRKAHYEIIENGDEPFYAEVPELEGVYSVGATLEAARETLQEVLEEWILARARLGLEIPRIGELDLNPQLVA
jgi:predicted RNase H-like HicB family nuclease